MLLGDQHLLELSTARHQQRQGACRGVGQRPYVGLDSLAKVRQDGCIQTVGLGQLSSRTRKIAHLAWIDDHHRQVLGGQRRRDTNLKATRRLDHNALRRQCHAPLHQRIDARGVMVRLPAHATWTNRYIQFSFADIDADPTGLLRHVPTAAPAFSTSARPCGYGLTWWWPWQLFGLCSSRTGRPRSLAASADQSRIGLSRPWSALLQRRTLFRDTKQRSGQASSERSISSSSNSSSSSSSSSRSSSRVGGRSATPTPARPSPSGAPSVTG